MAVSKRRTTQPENDQPDIQPKAYQPTLGRKLLMFVLCLAGLIIVWTYYFHASKP